MSPLQEEALRLAEELEPTAANLEQVGKKTTPEAARWAFKQWALRHKASAKFALTEKMLFTREALEQATHEALASYHASFFPFGARVADLTCGIGADSIALARRGPLLGFEIDPERAEYARHNLQVHGLDAQIQVQDGLSADWDFDYAFADPSRRVEGRRSLDPSKYSPRPEELAQRMNKLKLGILKLSPMLPDAYLESLGSCIEFVSFGGECREALVFVGAEAPRGRRALQVETGVRIEAGPEPPKTMQARSYLFEADPATIRAHALGTLCSHHNLVALADSNGYLTSDSPIQSPWLTTYSVVEQGNFDLKRFRKLLIELDAKVQVIKSRGCDLEPEHLLKKIKWDGHKPLILFLYRADQRVHFVLTQKMISTSQFKA